jgi:hypothetical protein
MDSGRTRSRRRFTPLRKAWGVEWEFSMPQYEAFMAFYNHSVDAGNTYFNLQLPLDEALSPQCVRFAGTISEQYKPHMRMVVSAVLETEVVETPSAAWLYAYEFSGGDLDWFLQFCSDFHTFVHITLPSAINGD